MKTLIITAHDSVGHAVSIGLQMRWPEMQVVHTTDAAQGWTLFCQTAPELILLDGNLPRRAGWELLRRMRAVCATPIILLLARGAELDRARGLAAGADDYLAQPFSHLELFARIQAVLRRAQPVLTPITEAAPPDTREPASVDQALSSGLAAPLAARRVHPGHPHARHRHPPPARRHAQHPGSLPPLPSDMPPVSPLPR